MDVPECIKRISPNWSKLLENSKSFSTLYMSGETDDGRELMLADASCCIVGEAHAFSSRYFHGNCVPCTEFSMLFYDLRNKSYHEDDIVEHLEVLSFSLGKDVKNHNEMELLQEFCNHFDAHHKGVPIQ